MVSIDLFVVQGLLSSVLIFLLRVVNEVRYHRFG